MLFNIRDLYTPRQPTVTPSSQGVRYTEHLPHIDLQPYVYCYWELKAEAVLTAPFNYTVVTDGCIDVFFNVHDPEESFIMGFCKRYTTFSLQAPFHYAGIRFLPTMFPQIFGVNAGLLSDRTQPLKVVAPALADFIHEAFSSRTNSEAFSPVLDDYFSFVINEDAFDHDGRLYEALELILRKQGVINLETAIDTGISHRQLRRLFKYYLGATPKSFSKVVRFQNILRAKPSTQSLKRNKLFYDLGYYDQAHFIKDFRNFYGLTPARAFGRE